LIKDDLIIFIPAQDANQYSDSGDLTPFGDTTLLQWKISQCKEFLPLDRIYVSSSSSKVRDVVLSEGVIFFEKDSNNSSIESQIKLLAKKTGSKAILWANATSPFLDKRGYGSMYKDFCKDPECDLMFSVEKKQEFSFFNGERVNFTGLVRRAEIDPVFLSTNGAYILNTDRFTEGSDILDQENFCLFELDAISSIEIKDISSYSVAQNLLSVYFSRILEDDYV